MSIEHNTELLIEAAKGGQVNEVRRLIPVADPKDNGSAALFFAAAYGHAHCVALLIPVSDPKCNNSRALYWSAKNSHIECVELLYPVSDPVVAIKNLKHTFPENHNKWVILEQMVDAERLNAVLNKEIGKPDKHPNELKVRRKI